MANPFSVFDLLDYILWLLVDPLILSESKNEEVTHKKVKRLIQNTIFEAEIQKCLKFLTFSSLMLEGPILVIG